MNTKGLLGLDVLSEFWAALLLVIAIICFSVFFGVFGGCYDRSIDTISGSALESTQASLSLITFIRSTVSFDDHLLTVPEYLSLMCYERSRGNSITGMQEALNPYVLFLQQNISVSVQLTCPDAAVLPLVPGTCAPDTSNSIVLPSMTQIPGERNTLELNYCRRIVARSTYPYGRPI